MALSGLDIYKLLPKTNCKACGFTTCLAFAMALAQKKTSLAQCPHVSEASKAALESASQPPIKLVTIGAGASKIEIGNETVMYRHEQKFFHPTAVGILVEDSRGADAAGEAAGAAGRLTFERAGQAFGVDLVCVKNVSGDPSVFAASVGRVLASTTLSLALSAKDPAAIRQALPLAKDRRPLIICGKGGDLAAFALLAKEYNAPLAVTASSVDEAALLTAQVKAAGVEEIVIDLDLPSISGRIQAYTYLRRMALRKLIRPLGYPILAFTTERESVQELAEASVYLAKYAGIIILRDRSADLYLPLLVERQDIYADPQKPVQVQPKIYEVGKVDRRSPVIVTTNFSITYFTVAGEVEASKVPAYIICCDAEGMSVLTAWAADKFTAERITDMLKKSGIEGMVDHRNIIIPGYVAVLSGKLAEVSGWKVLVGPREASGIPQYMRTLPR